MSSVSSIPKPTDDVTPAVAADKSVPAASTNGVAQLAHTLRFYWYIGHLFVFIGALNYLLSFFGVFRAYGFIWYRTAYVAALGSYGISIFETYFDAKRIGGTSPAPLLRDENLQYFAVAFLWLCTSPVVGSLVPFAIFALLHTLGYASQHLLPALGYPETTGIRPKLNEFSRRHNAALVYVAATAELFLLVRLALNLLLFRGFIKFAIYALFFRVRYETSRYNRQAVVTWERKVDGLVASAPPAVKNGWVSLKNVLGGLPVLTGASSISGLEKTAETKTSTENVGKATGVDTAKTPGSSVNTTGASAGVSENLRNKIETGLDETENTTSSSSFEKPSISTFDKAGTNSHANPLGSTFDKPSLDTPPLGKSFESSLGGALDTDIGRASDKPFTNLDNPAVDAKAQEIVDHATDSFNKIK
ncbi:hypothetical protein D0Z00_003424 [Geotrichum galactomycetum]|uniref:Uncharacterized protein n=1 Tax=Geotrichum galactomycetum TaxID=27317 RepID=A0ACB6V1D0_9ASCO|nr:hypothetical protein D0Z00_003424 [Geotrichum candidum]